MKRKLTPDEVRQILRRAVDGRQSGKRGRPSCGRPAHPDSQGALAKEFGVPQSSISRIVARQYHRTIPAVGGIALPASRRRQIVAAGRLLESIGVTFVVDNMDDPDDGFCGIAPEDMPRYAVWHRERLETKARQKGVS